MAQANTSATTLSGSDYDRMCDQLRSLQNSGTVPEQYRQALNNAITVLANNEIRNSITQESESRRGQQSQTMAASTGQGGSTTSGTGRTGRGQSTGSNTERSETE